MPKFSKSLTPVVLLSLILLLAGACSKQQQFRSQYKDANTLLNAEAQANEKKFLKAHLENGDVFIFRDTWKIDTVENFVRGTGEHYNFNRNLVNRGSLNLALDSVVIFETNTSLKSRESSRIGAITMLTAANITLGAYCLANPKACWGSCPTFYLDPSNTFHYADAEGFSNAIAPSLEYADIDALANTQVPQETFTLTMKNEALETHCLRQVQLFAYPLKPGQRVFQTRKNKFYRCSNINTLVKAVADEGNVTQLLAVAEKEERFSLADAENLSSKEEVEMTFSANTASNDLGLVLHYRQSLMTTYFIYSAISYMGNAVGDIFAQMERENNLKETIDKGLQKELGELEVHLWNPKKEEWDYVSSLYETGPIAINKQLVLLGTNNSSSSDSIRIKLLMNKGLWRIDYAALAQVEEEVQLQRVELKEVYKNGLNSPTSATALNDSSNQVISLPGDLFQLDFAFEKTGNYDLFLNSKGYYLEWRREAWLKEQELWKLYTMFNRPKAYLKAEAKDYKAYEEIMEEGFWNSRIESKNLSGND